MNESNEGLKNKAEKSGMSYSILKKVYDRGLAAYKTGHRPGTTAPQWAMARVNSFITKGSGTWGKADADLAKQVRGEGYDGKKTNKLGFFAKAANPPEMKKIPKLSSPKLPKAPKGEAVSPAQQAAIAISKKKKADGKSVNEWFEANATRAKYQLQHGDDWWWKMNETHDAMLEKLGLCCDDCLDEEKGPCWDGFKQVGMKNKGGKQVPNCVPESMSADEAKKIEGYVPEEVELDEMLDYAIIDGDNKIIGLYKGSNAKKQAQINMKGAKKQVQIKKPVKIVPVSNKKKGDTVIGIGESKLAKFNQFESLNAWGEVTEEDKSGKKLNNPTRGDVKKYKVYVKNDKGNVVKVEFGDPNMSIKRDDPARKKAFRARHNCDNPGPKFKARYWSCKFWSTKSVTDLMKG
jgi:hypothetical protein